jgi:hypothetical protein
MPAKRIYQSLEHRQKPIPYVPPPDPGGDVPWATRYTLPAAALAIAALLLPTRWLLTHTVFQH